MAGQDLMGPGALVLLSRALRIWGATEWTAWRLSLEGRARPARGCVLIPLADLSDVGSFFGWWLVFDADAPKVVRRGGRIEVCGGLVASVAFHRRYRCARAGGASATTYGRLRWAHRSEVARAGMLGTTGWCSARLGARLMRPRGPEARALFSPTRSGKGVGSWSLAGWTWPGSVIVHDIKGRGNGA